jgi:hypothetical protein
MNEGLPHERSERFGYEQHRMAPWVDKYEGRNSKRWGHFPRNGVACRDADQGREQDTVSFTFRLCTMTEDGQIHLDQQYDKHEPHHRYLSGVLLHRKTPALAWR